MDKFSLEFLVSWSDVDLNGHMRHTSYLDKCADVRVHFLNHYGLTASYMRDHQIGPVILKEYIEYKRETYLHDKLKVDLKLAGASPDTSRWIIEHNIYNSDNKRCATAILEGGFISLIERKLIPVPHKIQDAFSKIEKTADFKELRSTRPNLKVTY